MLSLQYVCVATTAVRMVDGMCVFALNHRLTRNHAVLYYCGCRMNVFFGRRKHTKLNEVVATGRIVMTELLCLPSSTVGHLKLIIASFFVWQSSSSSLSTCVVGFISHKSTIISRQCLGLYVMRKQQLFSNSGLFSEVFFFPLEYLSPSSLSPEIHFHTQTQTHLHISSLCSALRLCLFFSVAPLAIIVNWWMERMYQYIPTSFIQDVVGTRVSSDSFASMFQSFRAVYFCNIPSEDTRYLA